MRTEVATFVMSGAREVLRGGAGEMERQILAIEGSVSTNPGLTLEFSKTLIETTCRTILNDRAVEFDRAWDLPKLLKETLSYMRLAPDGIDEEADVTAAIKKALGGLNTAIQGICELRNTHGFASHGKDAYAVQLDEIQGILAARSADAIVHFLFRAHDGYPATDGSRVHYADNEEFNDWVDDQVGLIEIFNLEYKASEVLFKVDEEAYKTIWSEYTAPLEELESR